MGEESFEDRPAQEPEEPVGGRDSWIDADTAELKKLVDELLLGALSAGATGVHLEPCAEAGGEGFELRVRYRVDGRLVPGPFAVPPRYRGALLARLKIMTQAMDITERHRPQHGRIELVADGRRAVFYLEVCPTTRGEACGMRVLYPEEACPGLEGLGFLPDTMESLRGLLKDPGRGRNSGLLLVCGLTGSGRHTTVYSMLRHLARPDVKVMATECPVRRDLDGVLQIPANPDTRAEGGGVFDFATALRSMLRQDPDVVMVEELGDAPTAELMLKAAAAGYLVLTMVHSEDAASGVGRLVDMGLPPHLLAPGVKAALAQRLVRRLCPACKVRRPATAAEAAAFNAHGVGLDEDAALYGPGDSAGCGTCRGRGFSGVVALHELLVLTEGLRAGLAAGRPIEADASAGRGRTLSQDGLEKAKLGWTTVGEVLGA